MAEKTREQWVRAVRRWTVVGAVVGLVAGVVLGVRDPEEGVLSYAAFCLPAGAAMGVTLWGSAYRYDFARVWGVRLALLTAVVVVVLVATTVGIGCLQGACGSRP